MANITEELYKIKETKQLLKNIIENNGIKLNENTPFTEYPIIINDIISSYKNRIDNISSNICNLNNLNKNLYNSLFIDTKVKILNNYKIEVCYKSLSNEINGYVLGNQDIKIQAQIFDSYITDFIISNKDTDQSLYLFGYNNGSGLPQDEVPISIKYTKIYDDKNKLILYLIPYLKEDKICMFDILSKQLYYNQGIGEDFYQYKEKIKDINKFYSFKDIIKNPID